MSFWLKTNFFLMELKITQSTVDIILPWLYKDIFAPSFQFIALSFQFIG